jgi:hypothetical protein
MLKEGHADLPLRVILARMRHDGCGGRMANAELLAGVAGVGGWSVRGSCCGAVEGDDQLLPMAT